MCEESTHNVHNDGPEKARTDAQINGNPLIFVVWCLQLLPSSSLVAAAARQRIDIYMQRVWRILLLLPTVKIGNPGNEFK
jgi:hypothetical protein